MASDKVMIYGARGFRAISFTQVGYANHEARALARENGWPYSTISWDHFSKCWQRMALVHGHTATAYTE